MGVQDFLPGEYVGVQDFSNFSWVSRISLKVERGMKDPSKKHNGPKKEMAYNPVSGVSFVTAPCFIFNAPCTQDE